MPKFNKKLNKGDFVRTRQLRATGVFEGFKKGRYQSAVIVKGKKKLIRSVDKPRSINGKLPKRFSSGAPIPKMTRIKLIKLALKLRNKRKR